MRSKSIHQCTHRDAHHNLNKIIVQRQTYRIFILFLLFTTTCTVNGKTTSFFRNFETDNNNANTKNATNGNNTYDAFKDIPLTRIFRYDNPPRDALQGMTRAVKTIIQGTLIGITSFIGYPVIITSQKRNMQGFLMGVTAGIVSGVGFPIISSLVGFYQVLSGIMKTPNAVKCRFKGQVYNPSDGQWQYYFLEQESNFLKEYISQRRQNMKRQKRSDYNDFYEILDVTMNASSSDIKKAYHKKAKLLHPDKNLEMNMEDATNQFDALKKAYETLSNEHLRRAYDQNGATDKNFDVHSFFPLLLGLTPTTQKYVGDLGIVMFLDRIILDQGYRRNEDTSQMYKHMQTLREVNIAMHIFKQIKPFFDGTIDENEFIEACVQEANELGEGDFGAILLKTVGHAITTQSNMFLSSYNVIPIKYASSYTRKKFISMRENWGITRKTFGVMSSGFKSTMKTVKLYEKKNNRKINETPMTEESKRDFAQLLCQSMEDTIPNVFDLSWSIILKDISRTIQNACKKLFVDATIKEIEWKRRAEAVQILGEVFFEFGTLKTQESPTKKNKSVDDLIDQVEIAYVISMKEKQGIKVSQEEKETLQQILKRERKKRRHS